MLNPVVRSESGVAAAAKHHDGWRMRVLALRERLKLNGERRRMMIKKVQYEDERFHVLHSVHTVMADAVALDGRDRVWVGVRVTMQQCQH